MPGPKKTTPRVFRFTLLDIANELGLTSQNLRNYLSRHHLTKEFRKYTLGQLIEFIQNYPAKGVWGLLNK